jgi:O-antigen ligase
VSTLRAETGVPGLASESLPMAASRQLTRWILRAAAFLLPLAFVPNFVDEFVLPKLLLARFLVIILALALLVRWLAQGAVSWRGSPLDWPLIAFIASASLATLFAVNRNVALFGTYDRWEGLLTIIMYAFLFWLTLQLLSGEEDARGLTWSLLLSGYLIGAAAILQSGFGLLGGGYFHEGANGPIRADVTLANPDFLGIFLAMLIPVSIAKLVSRRPALTRVLAGNLVIILTLGLMLTFTRAAWIGAVVGVIIVLSLRRGRLRVRPLVASVAAIVIAVGVLAAVASLQRAGQSGLAGSLYSRIVSIADLRAGTESLRLRTWIDALPLIASRPIFGYGPDTFGLVYPPYQTSNSYQTLWDKPHEDALGVAATQGLLGVVAYLWILIAFIRAFWAGRYVRGAVALFGGWVAYELGTQVNFSYVPTSVPFWLFAAAAIITWAPKVDAQRVASFPRRTAIPVVIVGAILLASLTIPAVLMPALADSKYYAAEAESDLVQARALIAQARELAPYEARYAARAGSLALNPDSTGNPDPSADWAAALEAYTSAARLGSYQPSTFRRLAIVEEHYGNHRAAIAAARRALELDRFDANSQALLKKLTTQ